MLFASARESKGKEGVEEDSRALGLSKCERCRHHLLRQEGLGFGKDLKRVVWTPKGVCGVEISRESLHVKYRNPSQRRTSGSCRQTYLKPQS